MKRIFIILFTILHSLFTAAQEVPVSAEQQLENQADANNGETEDDSYLQELDHFKKEPVNVNMADADELKQLRILTDLQIATLISYRHLFGKLISIYELQAIPAWDVSTIRKLLPFVTTALPFSIKEETKRFRDGEHSLLLRVSQVLERSAGYDNNAAGTKYNGSPQRVLFRYRYMYKNLLQFGVVGDKDSGEQFFNGAQKKGFDFYSFHFFARKVGIIQAIAIGDFTVNMGQGLIQWQGLAFKKSVEVMGVKRQSAVLRPYSSAGEFYFNRGAGITIKKGRAEATAFVSIRKLSANFVTDTLSNEDFVSSFLTSGYNRTTSEIADKNKLTQTSFGGNIIYHGKKWRAGINGIVYDFSLPVQKRDEPYNRYAISGTRWQNFSADYSYTYKNIHFFGEAAIDKNFNTAFINGVLISADPRVDISVVQRTISKAYQSINGNAFTENTYPANETGLYAGITIRPATGWRIDAYGDVYKFPWLKYLVDGPSSGRDFLAQVLFAPNKQVEIYSRYRNESKQGNQSSSIFGGAGVSSITNPLVFLPRQSWRTQAGFKISTAITLRNRVEIIWYNKEAAGKETGFLSFADIIYKPMLSRWSGVLRLQYFETGGYDSRIYAYENDVAYSYSIPAFAGQGYRYYITVNADAGPKLSFWLRWAQTIYRDGQTIGSGADKIAGNRKTELKLQVRLLL